MPKNWCFWTVVLKTFESPLDCKEIKPVNPKGNQPWMFIESTEAEAETPILWPPDAKNWLIRKDPHARKDWRQREKGTRGWDSWIASLTGCTWVWASSRSWGWTGKPGVLQSTQSQELDTTERLNWTGPLRLRCFSTELQYYTVICWFNLQDQNFVYRRPTLSYMCIFNCRGLVN